MDKDIIKLVDKVFDVYSKTKLSLVNKKELVDKVLTYKLNIQLFVTVPK